MRIPSSWWLNSTSYSGVDGIPQQPCLFNQETLPHFQLELMPPNLKLVTMFASQVVFEVYVKLHPIYLNRLILFYSITTYFKERSQYVSKSAEVLVCPIVENTEELHTKCDVQALSYEPLD
ncbi:hypothetical protein SAMN05216406_1555 [Nitrosomonas ureae]|uniref:Uncharacterized protein n=1 Tax=Nitrosomonas ureae TaxID=44577 RepID=A0A1H2HLT1_9PROT|nr:hypothetical protein SAMN05216406_1555 [Nitrosomonas ureae]